MGSRAEALRFQDALMVPVWMPKIRSLDLKPWHRAGLGFRATYHEFLLRLASAAIHMMQAGGGLWTLNVGPTGLLPENCLGPYCRDLCQSGRGSMCAGARWFWLLSLF